MSRIVPSIIPTGGVVGLVISRSWIGAILIATAVTLWLMELVVAHFV